MMMMMSVGLCDMCVCVCVFRCSTVLSQSRKSRSVERLGRSSRSRLASSTFTLTSVRPFAAAKKNSLEEELPAQLASNPVANLISHVEEQEEKVFHPVGYELHLVDTIHKDILQKNLNVHWDNIAGLQEAKAILQVHSNHLHTFKLTYID